MKAFGHYLKTQCGLNNMKIPFYQKWVTDCYHYFNQSLENKIQPEQTKDFIRFLGRSRQDWQVKQAEHALQLFSYYKYKTENNNSIKSSKSAWVDIFEELKTVLRLKQRSHRTEKTYFGWIKRFSAFCRWKEPDTIQQQDVKNFLSYLAVEKKVGASTQNQAFNALLFLCRHVLNLEIDDLSETVRSRRKRRLPVVLTKDEVSSLLNLLSGEYRLMVKILYGGGLRLMECLRLRIMDVDLEQNLITVRSGKGDKDRITLLSESVKDELSKHLMSVKEVYEKDRNACVEGVALPGALDRKYPNAGREWRWFWVFPSKVLSTEPGTEIVRRHHIHHSNLQKHFKKAVDKAGIVKRAAVHTLCHSFATHLIENGYDIRTVQELMGHSNVQTTMIYTHVAQKNKLGVKSPLDG